MHELIVMHINASTCILIFLASTHQCMDSVFLTSCLLVIDGRLSFKAIT